MKMEQIECSEMSAYKIETPENYPKENILNTVLLVVLYECETRSLKLWEGLY